MPRPDITRRDTRRILSFAFLILLLVVCAGPCAFAQNPIPNTPPPSPPPPPGYPSSSNAQTDQSHHLKSVVDLVVLHATVVDDKGQFVPGLTGNDFRVFEDKVEQKISVFSKEDIPVTMGLVIDNSGSMKEKRPQVNAAALSFVRTSNPADEVFVVNFNDEYYLDLDEDFTSNAQELHEALERIDTRGSTALYDAIIGSLDHLKKGHKDKRVLLVITDGDDDASRKDFSYTVKAAVESNAVIYAIGVFSDEDRKNQKKMVRKSKKELTTLAESTGGLAFFPDRLEDVDPVCVQVARDIRNQYTLGYYPTNAAKDGTFRAVKVELSAQKGHEKLAVRTRTGYYAQKAAQGD
ncbi:MAG TPA: VWA domain-containing protein [Candidatus Acidoferrales bacterium]|nr:VWA domain-containing protein [Candidatus Acidoferrales bacterium]